MQVENVFILDVTHVTLFKALSSQTYKEVFVFPFLSNTKKKKKGFFGKHHLSKRVVLLTDAIVTL